MAKPLAIFCADTHLQDGAWADRPIKGDSYYAFEQIVDYAIENGVLAIFGAGDMIDRAINKSRPIVVLNNKMDRLAAAGIDMLFIQGQHEMSDVPWFDSHHLPTYLHKVNWSLPADDGSEIVVRGLDYQPAGKLQEELDAMPEGVDILLCHQVWGDFMGSVACPQGGFHDVSRIPTVFTGDYHVNKELEVRGKDGTEISVISPGSTCMQSIDEPNEKFFYVLNDDRTWSKVQLMVRPMIDWTPLLFTGDVEKFVALIVPEINVLVSRDRAAGVPEHIQKPLLRVTYSHKLENIRRIVTQAVGDRAHIFWKELVPQNQEVMARKEAAKREGKRRATTMESVLEPYLQEKDMAHLQSDAARLLQAQDVAGELSRMREDALK